MPFPFLFKKSRPDSNKRGFTWYTCGRKEIFASYLWKPQAIDTCGDFCLHPQVFCLRISLPAAFAGNSARTSFTVFRDCLNQTFYQLHLTFYNLKPFKWHLQLLKCAKLFWLWYISRHQHLTPNFLLSPQGVVQILSDRPCAGKDCWNEFFFLDIQDLLLMHQLLCVSAALMGIWGFTWKNHRLKRFLRDDLLQWIAQLHHLVKLTFF